MGHPQKVQVKDSAPPTCHWNPFTHKAARGSPSDCRRPPQVIVNGVPMCEFCAADEAHLFAEKVPIEGAPPARYFCLSCSSALVDLAGGGVGCPCCSPLRLVDPLLGLWA